MKHPFYLLTHDDVEFLRRQPGDAPNGSKGIYYNFTSHQIYVARMHLETLYTSRVQRSFAEKILVRIELY